MANATLQPSFPRLPLYTALALIGFSFAAVAFGRFTEIGTVRVESGSPIDIRDIRFADMPAGEIRVIDNHTGETITVLPAGGDGFIRGAMRGLARDRRLRGVPQGDPYRLIQYSTGRLTLSDPAAHLVVDLAAFGPTNQASFARFLNTPPAGSAKP